jgi:predicted RNA binding protein YcfA (HicA-like mRNA interferase family)
MGKRNYPPLTPAEVVAVLQALKFKVKRQVGSHAHFERLPDEENNQRRIVTVDMGVRDFSERLLKSMIRQSGFERDRFYGATKTTARKGG